MDVKPTRPREDDDGLNELEKIRGLVEETPKIIETIVNSGGNWISAFEKQLETLFLMLKKSGKDHSIVPEYKKSLAKRLLSVKEELSSRKNEINDKNFSKESKKLLLKMLNNLREDE